MRDEIEGGKEFGKDDDEIVMKKIGDKWRN
jgi:hypothetical protein